MTEKEPPRPPNDNAEWCGAMRRAQGVSGALGARARTSAGRTPCSVPTVVTLTEDGGRRPDAVTLTEDATADDVRTPVHTGLGCSVKDSFAEGPGGPRERTTAGGGPGTPEHRSGLSARRRIL